MRRALLLLITLTYATSGKASDQAPDDNRSKKTAAYTFVIVHGSTGGGWDWQGVDQRLSQNHHRVYRPTLTGLGERAHLARPDINLDTHVRDIVNVIMFENLKQVILVGHSYAGIVITGVMNEIPERIQHAIFLDAFVPAHGMSAFDTWAPAPPSYKLVDGQVYFPWLDDTFETPGDRPQSLKTFTQPVNFDKPAAKKIPATYVAFVSPQAVAKRKVWDTSWRRAEKRGWKILTLDSDHNAQRSHPDELSALLQQAPGA